MNYPFGYFSGSVFESFADGRRLLADRTGERSYRPTNGLEASEGGSIINSCAAKAGRIS